MKNFIYDNKIDIIFILLIVIFLSLSSIAEKRVHKNNCECTCIELEKTP